MSLDGQIQERELGELEPPCVLAERQLPEDVRLDQKPEIGCRVSLPRLAKVSSE